MRAATIISIAVATLLGVSTLAQAEPPPGVGAADVSRDGLCYVVWVDVGGQSTPILPGGEGLVFVDVEEVLHVYSNDANGNQHLRCHGRLPLGEDVLARDFVTFDEILATLPPLDEACEALSPAFPEACRGEGAVIFNYDTTGEACTIGGVPATVWSDVTTRQGVVNLSCHILP